MNRGIIVILATGVVLIAALIIIHMAFGPSTGWDTSQYKWEGDCIMGPWMMTGFGGWWIMGIVWLVVIGLIVWLVVYLVRGSSTASSTGGEVKAVVILKTRYARGEIDKKEYEEKLKDLQ